MKYSLGISNFLEEISNLFHSIVFLYFFALITLSYLSLLSFGTLHSNGYIFPFPLWLLLLFSHLFLSPLQTTILPFCISFSWGWSRSLPHVQCHEPLSIDLQAYTLSIRSNPLNLCLTSSVLWGIWFRSYLNGLVVFPTFFNLSLNLTVKNSWSEPHSSPSLAFADCIELPHLWLQRI